MGFAQMSESNSPMLGQHAIEPMGGSKSLGNPVRKQLELAEHICRACPGSPPSPSVSALASPNGSWPVARHQHQDLLMPGQGHRGATQACGGRPPHLHEAHTLRGCLGIVKVQLPGA